MGDCHPTRTLRDEHTLILQVIDAFERCLDRGRPGLSGGEIRDFVDFFRLYTDALHHGKEEGVLFEAMAEQGFSEAVGPIAHMLEEHRLGRALVRQMADGADALNDQPSAWRAVENTGRSYVDLIRHHILKEDHGVFDMADDAIDEAACQRICHAYDAVCTSRFEGRTLEHLEQLGKALVARYER
jgi:hemerythrin-like domain-containing protein